MKEAIFQPFWFVFFSFIRMQRSKKTQLYSGKIQTKTNQINIRLVRALVWQVNTESSKRHSGLKHFTVSWFYGLFLEISNDDLNKGKIKLKKSQRLCDKKLNLRV